VPAEALDTEVADLVASMLPLAPMTQAASKDLINAIADGADAEALHRRWYGEWSTSPDGVEGPTAFLQKRKPVFSWRPTD
jgi:enoyl-CoA hydratase/carnithine racemase